jgi:hypothetical protein
VLAMFRSDSQRRAMFAKMNKTGVNLSSVLDDDSNLVVSSSDVPDWVTSSSVQVVQEVPVHTTSGPDYLKQYANTIKPSVDSILIGDDVVKPNDAILQYASDMEPEKKIVGATEVDDEYANKPVNLTVKTNYRKLKKMDKLLHMDQ